MKRVRFTRFEQKILGAMVAVALVPLIGSLVLGRLALVATYEVGVNTRVEEQLKEGLDVYRAYFRSARREATRTVDAIAEDHELRTATDESDDSAAEQRIRALIDAYPNVAEVRLLKDEEARVAVSTDRNNDEARVRPLTLTRSLRTGEIDTVEVTVVTDAKPFSDYQRAGEIAEVYARLEESSDYVSTSYLAVYIGFLLSVIVLALGVGFVVSRRVTRRVADLAEATKLVGAGDLSVSLPARSADEIGELTTAFNQMVADLRQSRERIEYLKRIGEWQEFARRLAHEIKNPLTPIRLAAQEISRSYDGEDEKFRRKLEDASSIIEEEVATLKRLVGEFSEFARLPRAELAPADLNSFVSGLPRSVTAMPDTDERFASSAVRCVIHSDPLPVALDDMMMARCVDNLVRNALQAIESAGLEGGSVVIESKREGRFARLEIRDNGPGIPEEKRGRVFDPYYTTKTEGTGLGLAIVKKVALEHEGDVSVSVAAEGGACFGFRLPLYDHVGGGQPTSNRSGRKGKRERGEP